MQTAEPVQRRSDSRSCSFESQISELKLRAWVASPVAAAASRIARAHWHVGRATVSLLAPQSPRRSPLCSRGSELPG